MTTKRIQSYETPEIVVTFDPNVCIHSGVCVRGLPMVFDVRRKRWVQPEHASAADVAAQVARCPSGALQARLKGGPGTGAGEVGHGRGDAPAAPPDPD